MNNEQKVIAMLERIVAGDLTGIREDLGLCWNILVVQQDRDKREDFIVVDEHYSSWKYFSGHLAHPIKSPWYSLKSPTQYYETADNKYQGRQLLMRQSLAKHLIKCIKEDIVT